MANGQIVDDRNAFQKFLVRLGAGLQGRQAPRFGRQQQRVEQGQALQELLSAFPQGQQTLPATQGVTGTTPGGGMFEAIPSLPKRQVPRFDTETLTNLSPEIQRNLANLFVGRSLPQAQAPGQQALTGARTEQAQAQTKKALREPILSLSQEKAKEFVKLSPDIRSGIVSGLKPKSELDIEQQKLEIDKLRKETGKDISKPTALQSNIKFLVNTLDLSQTEALDRLKPVVQREQSRGAFIRDVFKASQARFLSETEESKLIESAESIFDLTSKQQPKKQGFQTLTTEQSQQVGGLIKQLKNGTFLDPSTGKALPPQSDKQIKEFLKQKNINFEDFGF